jgi:hypothetical protein
MCEDAVAKVGKLQIRAPPIDEECEIRNFEREWHPTVRPRMKLDPAAASRLEDLKSPFRQIYLKPAKMRLLARPINL